MTIYDQAREALNKATPGPWRHVSGDNGPLEPPDMAYVEISGWPTTEGVCEADAALIALAPELAAEVVRLHGQLGGLADELEREAESVASDVRLGDCRTVRALTLSNAAARIRAVLNGGE